MNDDLSFPSKRSGLSQSEIERAAFQLYGHDTRQAAEIAKLRDADPYSYGFTLGTSWAIRASLKELINLSEWNERMDNEWYERAKNGRQLIKVCTAESIYLGIHPEHMTAHADKLKAVAKDFWYCTVVATNEDISEEWKGNVACMRGFVSGAINAFLDFKDAALFK